MKRLNLALLYGGISSEREVSIAGGRQVFEALDKEKYAVTVYDPKTDLGKLVNDATHIDVALIILHGPYGEDGTIQGLLELLHIPYQGAGVLGSSVAIDKQVSKKMFEAEKLPVPQSVALNEIDGVYSELIVAKLGLPLFVKPATGGSSIGMSLVRSEDELVPAVEKALRFDSRVLVEAFIEGTELTCAVIGNDTLEALPVIEIIPDNGTSIFFDYEAKYTPGATQEICPARIPDSVTERVQKLAVKAHNALNLRGCSRTDMILKGDDLYILETNTIPGMTETSLLPLAAKTAGMSFSALLDRLIELAMEEEG